MSKMHLLEQNEMPVNSLLTKKPLVVRKKKGHKYTAS